MLIPTVGKHRYTASIVATNKRLAAWAQLAPHVTFLDCGHLFIEKENQVRQMTATWVSVLAEQLHKPLFKAYFFEKGSNDLQGAGASLFVCCHCGV